MFRIVWTKGIDYCSFFILRRAADRVPINLASSTPSNCSSMTGRGYCQFSHCSAINPTHRLLLKIVPSVFCFKLRSPWEKVHTELWLSVSVTSHCQLLLIAEEHVHQACIKYASPLNQFSLCFLKNLDGVKCCLD